MSSASLNPRAAIRRGSKLSTWWWLALDEIGNLVPLPSLPTLMAEGGGTGITTMPVLQVTRPSVRPVERAPGATNSDTRSEPSNSTRSAHR